MPLIFIHGINTRDTDPAYFIAKEARKKLFGDIVVARMRNQFPGFAVLDDIYWGDLGVKFRWKLQSVPQTDLLESLGADSPPARNTAVLQVIAAMSADRDATSPISDAAYTADEFETLGPARISQPLVDSVARLGASGHAGNVVRAVVAPEADRYAGADPAWSEGRIDAAELEERGRQLALLVTAADQAAAAADRDPHLLHATTDAAVLDKVGALIAQQYWRSTEKTAEQVDDGAGFEELGVASDARDWAVKRLGSLIQGAKSAVAEVHGKTTRAASLLALEQFRYQLTRRGLRFFGDIFVYLRQGSNGEIARRVQTGIRNAWDIAHTIGEPLLVVTHSFGSELLYDSLTSGSLDGIEIALWASVGAQTSLFTEMALYGSSDPNLPDTSRPTLGKPKQVKKWINFFDTADLLSYLHEPVYGSAAVADIEVREGANLGTAHGHYFLVPSFYERIGSELALVC